MCKAGQFTTRSFYYKNVSDSEYMILRKKKAGITNLWFASGVKGSLKTWLAYKRNSFR